MGDISSKLIISWQDRTHPANSTTLDVTEAKTKYSHLKSDQSGPSHRAGCLPWSVVVASLGQFGWSVLAAAGPALEIKKIDKDLPVQVIILSSRLNDGAREGSGGCSSATWGYLSSWLTLGYITSLVGMSEFSHYSWQSYPWLLFIEVQCFQLLLSCCCQLWI